MTNGVRLWLHRGLVGLLALLASEPTSAHGEPVVAPRFPLSLRFIENHGQWDGAFDFAAMRGRATVLLQRDRAIVRLAQPAVSGSVRGVVLHLVFEESQGAAGVGRQEINGAYNFFIGSDPSRWQSDVPAFSEVHYPRIYEGVELRWYERQGRLEYDLAVEPHADLNQVAVRFEGADNVALQPDGSVLLATPLGVVRHTAPVAWEQELDGTRRSIACQYQLIGNRLSFNVPLRSPEATLIIDPGLEWSTLLGGSNRDEVTGVALSDNGEVTIAGQTGSLDFPVTPGAFDTTHAGGTFIDDVFVARLDPSGSSLIYCTFLGGGQNDICTDVALSATGEAVVSGWTGSADYPVTAGAFDRTYNGSSDIYITRLNDEGTDLVYSTYLGGSSLENSAGMRLAGDGVVTVAGQTNSQDFPVTGAAYDSQNTGAPLQPDAFVAKLSSAGDSLLWATLLGGSGSEFAEALDVADDGTVVIAGRPSSTGFPVTANFGTGIFLARFDPALSRLLYATNLGGTGDDRPNDLAVDASGTAYLTGSTAAADFPTTAGAFDTTFNGGVAGYVLRLNSTGTGILYGTYIGGGNCSGEAIEVDSGGVVTIVGHAGAGVPTTPGALDTLSSATDLFVSRLSPNGSSLWYSTYLGGSDVESHVGSHLIGLALGPEGESIVVSQTASEDYPTTPGAYSTTPTPISDGVITMLDMLPTGAEKYGASTPGCEGPLAIGVTSMPQVGKPFGLTCTNAPASSAQGILVLGLTGLSQSLPAKGAEFWVNPVPLLLLLPAGSNGLGLSWLQGAIPNAPGLVGVSFAVQFFWPNGCGPAGSMSASNALLLTIQS